MKFAGKSEYNLSIEVLLDAAPATTQETAGNWPKGLADAPLQNAAVSIMPPQVEPPAEAEAAVPPHEAAADTAELAADEQAGPHAAEANAAAAAVLDAPRRPRRGNQTFKIRFARGVKRCCRGSDLIG